MKTTIILMFILLPLALIGQTEQYAKSGFISTGSAGNVSACSPATGCVTLDLRGFVTAPTVGIAVQGSGFAGTLNFEASVDCSNWFSQPVSSLPFNTSTTLSSISSVTAIGQWTVSTAGLCGVRTRALPGWVGTAQITMRPTGGNNPLAYNVPVVRSGDFTFRVVQGCNSQVSVTVTAGSTLLVVGSSPGFTAYLCSVTVGIATTGTVQWMQGTGSNCGTSTTAISVPVTLSAGNVWNLHGMFSPAIASTVVGQQICLAAVTGNAQVFVTYGYF